MTQGARLTLVDLTDPAALRYRHVLLVEPFLRDDGSVDVRPVHGARRRDRLARRPRARRRHHPRVQLASGSTTSCGYRPATRPGCGCAARPAVDAFGYRYLLPVRFTYDAHAGHGTDRLRYSFASLDRSTTPHGWSPASTAAAT